MASERTRNTLSVLALVLGFLVAVALLGGAILLSFCGLWGEECTASEERTIGLLTMGSFGVFLLVPAVVAVVRRQRRWLLAPVIEAGIIATTFALLDWF